MVWVTAISTARVIRLPAASMIMPLCYRLGSSHRRQITGPCPASQPCCLRIGKRDFFGRFAPLAAFARTVVATTILVTASGIENTRYSRTARGASSAFGDANGSSPGIRFVVFTSALIRLGWTAVESRSRSLGSEFVCQMTLPFVFVPIALTPATDSAATRCTSFTSRHGLLFHTPEYFQTRALSWDDNKPDRRKGAARCDTLLRNPPELVRDRQHSSLRHRQQ
jgi:hypothetical protein